MPVGETFRIAIYPLQKPNGNTSDTIIKYDFEYRGKRNVQRIIINEIFFDKVLAKFQLLSLLWLFFVASSSSWVSF